MLVCRLEAVSVARSCCQRIQGGGPVHRKKRRFLIRLIDLSFPTGTAKRIAKALYFVREQGEEKAGR